MRLSSNLIPIGPEPSYQRVVSGYETFHSPKAFRLDREHETLGIDAQFGALGGVSTTPTPESDSLHVN